MPRRDQIDNPYTRLGVSPTDDFATIRAAWRKLVKTYHPDVWFGSELEATRRLMAVNDAFDQITVLHKRVRAEAEAMAKAEQAKPQPRRKPQKARKPRPEATARSAAEPQQTAPARAPRPSPFADRFDKARAAFGRQPEAKVQAFA
ncbi:J domain-containing protein [Primorskyibacter sp. 2E107]|uniref:J domain-containing protein n=1 Tax=Primorskyibacter sp. 2E107 TaxID=3403458 RepID=UPI003AF7C28B